MVVGMEATTATDKLHTKMKIKNAISKLTKAGFNITNVGNKYTAAKAGCKYVVEFIRNGSSDETACVGYRHQNQFSDSMSDYCATFFCDNLSKAIASATR
jgi:hypothetical protein